MASTVPDTDKIDVAALSVAWEIVRATYVTGNTTATGQRGADELADAVIRAYSAILTMKETANRKS